jgi:U3 small nucleolar RNA-associated protein 20
MAAMSSGRKDKPLKWLKGGTDSMRKHRFESFNQRVAKLKIDPLRRSRDFEVDVNDTTSFLHTGLAKWKETNLSETFTIFVRDLTPLCDTLAHILYHHENIMSLLVTYIAKKDALSLEPLLDMLGRFAHDLGIKFEPHFGTAVTLVASLATSHNDIEVVEWSFTCLAWLFKYLSRLLVPDLRPLFHIMAPLLGKVPQKFHTTRFAAESMSFLLKKAAVVYHKNQLPLTKIIDCILQDLESIDEDQTGLSLYNHGLMTLLLESIKGIDRRLHSRGDSVYRCLIERYLHRDASSAKTEQVIVGLSVGLIHHTQATAYRHLLDVVFRSIQMQGNQPTSRSVLIHSKLLFVAAGVREGSRVQDWSGMLDALSMLLSHCAWSNDVEICQILETAALLLQSASLDIVILRLRSIMDIISHEKNTNFFMLFCDLFCDIGRERFHDLLYPYFSRYLVYDLG